MKKSIFLFLLAFIPASCRYEELTLNEHDVSFEAQTENFSCDTRTSLSENRNVVWSSGDEIIIYEGGTTPNHYRLDDESSGSSNASFAIFGNRTQGDDFDANISVYPSDIVESLSYSDGIFVLDVTIPSVQGFTPGSFAEESFPMTALTASKEDKRLRFKNVSGAVRLTLKGDELIRSITFSGNSGEVLAGAAVISTDVETGLPELKMSESGAKEIMMNCGDEGVQLSPYKATEFVFSVPPHPFEGGFHFTIILDGGAEYVLNTDKPNPVSRSSVLNMPLCKVDGTALDDVDEPVFEITELNAVNVELTANLGDVEYYLGGQEASTFDSNVALQMMNEICKYDNPTDRLIHNEYPFGFVGNPGDFVKTAYFDYFPQVEYVIWVIPYVEGKKDYTEEDIIKVLFKGASLQPGGTVNLTKVNSVVNATSVTVSFDMNGAAAIGYAWVEESEIQGLEEADLRDIIINRHSITLSESLTYKAMPEETKVLLAVAIDSEGRVGDVYKETFTTSPYSFNELEVTIEGSNENGKDGGSFNIRVSEQAYGYFSILTPSWGNQYTEMSDIDNWMIYNVGSWGYVYDTETPADSFVHQYYGTLDLGVEYTFFVMAKDADGKYSHTYMYSFFPKPSEEDLTGWGIIGTFNGWDDDLLMESDGNYLVYKEFTVDDDYTEDNTCPIEFKFRKDGGWDREFGAAFYGRHQTGVAYEPTYRGSNIVLPDNGTYDIYLSKFLNKYYIMPQGEKPSDYAAD